MQLTAKSVQEEIAGLMDSYTGAISRVITAYSERRNRDRDINWLALQATKEYGAMVYHARVMFRKAKDMESLESIRKSSEDSFEEAEHYWGLMKILDWYLDGKPCEVREMWGYGDFTEALGPGPGMNKSLWPESHGYFELAQQQMQQTRSNWVRQVIAANIEGAAVAFHYLMSRLPATDEYMRRIVEHERSIAKDELHHGPEMIEELAKIVQSREEVEEAKQKLTDLRVRELRQRNEQFLHPLTPAEINQLEEDFLQRRVEPISLFSMGVEV
ncbi:MAG: hypothetical protein HYX73_08825 [Acidobacteria bacterium]|nr:hypothetical protein [Acidobacteriota bacterium]